MIPEDLRADLFRYKGNVDFKSFFMCYLSNAAFRWQVAFRLVNSHGAYKLIGLFLWCINMNRKRIQIPRKTKIGGGLYIGHDGPVVINPSAKIGCNCNLSQFVTIGSNQGRAAQIGDNVYVGPSVCLVENVIIGNNVTIGAGSVVTKDLPSNATAAGNYAKVLNYRNPGRYIRNSWTFD